MAVTEQRRRLDALHRAVRERQRSDAFAFVWGAGLGVGWEEEHARHCAFPDDPCSRSYDLYPTSECDPYPSSMYEGSLIGAMYEGHVDASVFLAGWRVEA